VATSRENLDVDWVPVISTAVGAAVALSATLLSYVLRSRDERGRAHRADRQQSYLDFMLALDGAHARLREVAEPTRTATDLDRDTGRAVSDSKVYEARERLLMSASPAVVRAGERAFLSVIEMRDAVRKGAKRGTVEFHHTYHVLSEAKWRLRRTVRVDLDSKPLTLTDLDKTSWDAREDCELCAPKERAAAE